MSSQKRIESEGFAILELLPPDFEEFLMFHKKSSDVKNSFNVFLKNGGIPELINLLDFDFISKEQELLQLMGYRGINVELLKQIASSLSLSSSIYRIYTQMKKESKISKDTVYRDIVDLIDKRVVFYIDEFGTNKPQQRFFFFDHTLRDALLPSRDFIATFANMIFCEIRKKSDEKIVFTKQIDFLLENANLGVISAPFTNMDGGIKKVESALKDYQGLKYVTFITLGNSFEFEHLGVECEGIPFWEWALRE